MRVGKRCWSGALLGLTLATSLTGCVERRYTIRTDPPGALVVVNNEEIGRAPVARSFSYYGDRDITLILDGHQTQRVIQPIDAPWYDNILTEFVSECIVPITLRDERDFTFKMAPTVVPPANELLGRAEALRTQAQIPPPPRRGGLLGFFGF